VSNVDLIMYEFLNPYYNTLFRSFSSVALKAWTLANYHPVWPAHLGIGNMITALKRSVGKASLTLLALIVICHPRSIGGLILLFFFIVIYLTCCMMSLYAP